MRGYSVTQAIFTAKDATGVGNAFFCKPYKNITLAVSAAVNSSLTFKVQGSIGTSATSDAAPDFASAQSATNHWDYIAMYDLQTPGTVITGDTGVTLNNDTVANNTHLYIVNVDALSWLNIEVTSRTDGDVTAFVVGFDNE